MRFGGSRYRARSAGADAQAAANAMADAMTASIVDQNRKVKEATERLEAELAAIEPPRDLYRITKKPEDGTFTVSQWQKGIDGLVQFSGFGGRAYDFRSIRTDWVALTSGLASLEAAEAWLKQYLDPTTNRISYDAEGNRLTPPVTPPAS